MPTVQYRSACNGRSTAVGEPENTMKRRKVLLSEEELLETKSTKRDSEIRKQTLHRH